MKRIPKRKAQKPRDSAFKEARTPNPEPNEVATAQKDIDLFAGYLKVLENPDAVLRTEAAGKGLKLYDEIDRDPHAGSVLQTRYLSVVGKEWEVLPGEEASARGRRPTETFAEKIAGFVKNALLGCNFDQFRQELLQGILYGFYGAEVMWKVLDNNIVPARILAKHPRRFAFTPERALRLITVNAMLEGEPVPDRKFIVFTYGSSDNPYGSGLGQKLWWPVWFKKNAIKFWLIFSEKFGMPTTVGKYPPGTDPTAQQALLDAIDAIQTETGVKIPDTMTIELLEAQRQGSVNTYETLCTYMDKQISKAVLGQTATTEGTPGKLGNEEAQQEVRQDIVKADADLLCECLNSSLIRWICDFNFPNPIYPKIWIRTGEEEDLKPLAERDEILVSRIGLPVARRYFYETYAIPEPEEGEEIVSPRQANPMGNGVPGADDGAFAEKKTTFEAMKKAQEKIDRLVDGMVEKAAPVFGQYTESIRKFIDAAQSLESAKEGIAGLYEALSANPLAGLLTESLEMADAIGAERDAGSGFAEAQWGPGTPFEEARDFFRAKAFTISGVTKADLLSEVKGEIDRAMQEGVSITDFRKSVNEIFATNGYDALHPHRIDTIFRTNIQSAYQAGRFRQMTQPAVAAYRPYWRYVAVLDPSTRPEHAALNGKIFRYDHPFWQTWYPPNGFNCRCTVQTVSEDELERNGWTVETEDPTGTLAEPLDPATGVKMPARLIMPDPGWSGEPNRLEKLLEDKGARKRLEEAGWKEMPDQPGPEQLGRPVESRIPAQSWKPSPGKAASIEERVRITQIPKTEAIAAVEDEYKRAMGISPNESIGVLKGPDGEIVQVNLSSLAHAIFDRKSARERYLNYFRQVIEDPYEILLTEYEQESNKSKYRKKYIGLFEEGKRAAVIVVAEISKEGWAMWNVINARQKTIDRIRHGVRLLYGQ